MELGEEGVSVWIDDNEDEGIKEIELDFHVKIVDWEEDIDETGGDVEIVDCMKVVGLKVELVGGSEKEKVGVSVWTDDNEDEEIEVNLGVDIEDWVEVTDKTVVDVVVEDGIGVVGWEVELEIGWGEESVGVFVWIDDKEDDGVE